MTNYCRENKVAIVFDNPEQLKAINAAFDRKAHYADMDWKNGGIVSHTVINHSTNCYSLYRVTANSEFGRNAFTDYAIITAAEFFELIDEGTPILKTNNQKI